MSNFARSLGLIAALVMGVFSAYIYLKTGDWVAAVFCLGSVAYFIFFISKQTG
ncbi:MAG: hypothetical protein ACI9J0_003866 [Cryomorphaceae bacterium]|jgi:hypothetical protein